MSDDLEAATVHCPRCFIEDTHPLPGVDDERKCNNCGLVFRVCPECGSTDIEKHAYPDGNGHTDIENECADCGEKWW